MKLHRKSDICNKICYIWQTYISIKRDENKFLCDSNDNNHFNSLYNKSNLMKLWSTQMVLSY